MQTVLIYSRDHLLPAPGWIQLCNGCLNATACYISEKYNYYNEEYNMQIILCNKCQREIKTNKRFYDEIIKVSNKIALKKIILKDFEPITQWPYVKPQDKPCEKKIKNKIKPIDFKPQIKKLTTNQANQPDNKEENTTAMKEYRKSILDKVDERIKNKFTMYFKK